MVNHFFVLVDNNRKRPLEDSYGIDGPETKKLSSDGTVPPGTQAAPANAKAIAQAAISKYAYLIISLFQFYYYISGLPDN